MKHKASLDEDLTCRPDKSTKVFTYYRVSTPGQRDKDTYLSQKLAVENYLTELGFEIEAEFTDLGLSGADNDRPGVNEMLSRLDEVDGIAVFSRSRITRDYFFGSDFNRTLLLKRKLLVVAEDKQVIDPANRDDPILMNWLDDLIAVMNQKQRESIRNNILSGIQRHRAETGKWGPNRKEPNWNKVEEMIAGHFSKAAIVRFINADATKRCKKCDDLRRNPKCKKCKISMVTFHRRLRDRYFTLKAEGVTNAEFAVRYNVNLDVIANWESEGEEG